VANRVGESRSCEVGVTAGGTRCPPATIV